MSIDWPTTFLGKLEKRYEDQNNPCGTAAGIGGSVCVNRLRPVEAVGGNMTKDEALDLALRSLKELVPDESDYAPAIQGQRKRQEKAITAIKQALALDKKAENARKLGLDYEPALKDNSNYRLDPPVAEPVAWMYPDDYERMLTSETFCTVYSVEVGSATRGESTVALYTTPPAQPCPTCEALARTVMMDQTGRDA
jgi:hypothetical protein